ncbi:hypothetical protein Tco_1321686, partial [Tanacetum coccineum]
DSDFKENIIVGVPDLDGPGFSKENIHVEYEWKPPRCPNCNIFGHTSESCPKRVVAAPEVTNIVRDDHDDGFQQVRNRKRNSKGNTKGKQAIPRGVPMSKGFQVGKEFAFNPKATVLDSNGGSKSAANSKASSSSSLNKGNLDTHSNVSKPGPSITTNDRHSAAHLNDGGKKSIVIDSNSNLNTSIPTSNPYDALKSLNEDDDSEEEDVENIFDESVNLFTSQTGASTPADIGFNVYMYYRWKWTSNGGLCTKGDFNAALNLEDHSCGGYEPNISMREFKECVQRIEVMDVNATRIFIYLESKTEGRNARNRIEMVKDMSNIVYEGNEVAGAFVSHYEQFLGVEGSVTPLDNHDLFSRVLDVQKAAHMVRNVSDAEIKSALFSMSDDKAPRPDGFTAVFFKKAWDIVGDNFSCAIRDFFSNGKLLREIIANRIKGDLGYLVSINQSAFVLGRRISDNILLTQELMRNYHRNCRPPRCSFKVDIQKAYDTVDWGFLRSILIGFGFHPTMIEWIMVCVSTLLQRRVSLAEDFRFHHHCEKQRIINLCFADDLFLFARGHLDSVSVIMDTLDEFMNVSGLVPSIPKSTAFFCNVPIALKSSILNLMPFAEGTLPVRYLGVPLISSRLLYRDCKVLVEKLESRVNDWRNKFLSLAGRMQLVRSVLSSMHIYWASVFILPVRIISDLEQLMRGFLWCQGEMKKGKAKVAWDSVCLPLKEGGLGIRRLEEFNTALMVSHIWSILNARDSLWVQWIYDYKSKVWLKIRILCGMDSIVRSRNTSLHIFKHESKLEKEKD